MKTLIGVPNDPIKELLKEADTSVKKGREPYRSGRHQ